MQIVLSANNFTFQGFYFANQQVIMQQRGATTPLDEQKFLMEAVSNSSMTRSPLASLYSDVEQRKDPVSCLAVRVPNGCVHDV